MIRGIIFFIKCCLEWKDKDYVQIDILFYTQSKRETESKNRQLDNIVKLFLFNNIICSKYVLNTIICSKCVLNKKICSKYVLNMIICSNMILNIFTLTFYPLKTPTNTIQLNIATHKDTVL